MTFVAMLSFVLTTFLAAPAADPPPQLAEARALLEGGKAAEAFEKAKEGLEYSPDLLELLDLASRAAGESGAADEALWYGALASAALADLEAPSKAEQAIAVALPKRLLEMDPLGQKGPTILNDYSAAIAAIGKESSGKKLYVNAVDLLGRCRGTAASAKAEAELAKIYANKKAVEALLGSGLDVPIQQKRRRSPESIAREDAKHSTWETAHVIKGKQYTIKTDMGLELAEQMSLAMEQMNAYYRKVFHVKEFGGGQTAQLTIRVYKTRAEFDEGEKKDLGQAIDPNVRGHIVYAAGYVATYDPRTDQRPFDALWSTLFHESSHQFTKLISADLIPGWLNEGTASYFEGARLRASGIVETNLVPDGRLKHLEIMLRQTESSGTSPAKNPEGVPSLHDVVSYFQPGSYPGEYYPFGWGLVYFLLNYEDEKSQRVYDKPYQDFMASYGSGGKHDVKGRFVEYFVTKAKQPDVTTFEQFEARWRKWIHELHELHFGGPAMADRLIERGRKQIADKAYESAEQSLLWALRKRPGDPLASFELAELMTAQKRNDAAIYRYRAAIAGLRTLEDSNEPLPGGKDFTGQDLLDISEKALLKLDKPMSEGLKKADADFATGIADTARAYAEKELPRSSLELLDSAQRVFGPSKAFAELRDEIAKASSAETRRWRRLQARPDLPGWEAGSEWTAKDGALAGKSDGPDFCTWRETPPARYTFEATLDATALEDEKGFVGMFFGDQGGKLQFVAFTSKGTGLYGKLDEEGFEQIGPLASLKKDDLGSFTFRIEVFPDRAEFFVNGKSAGKPKAYDPEDLSGRVGVFVQGGQTTIRDVRLCY